METVIETHQFYDTFELVYNFFEHKIVAKASDCP